MSINATQSETLVQQFSSDNCMASTKDCDNILSVTVNRDYDLDNFHMTKESYQSMNSTVLDLNLFESDAFAYFNSQKSPQGNTSLRVRMFKHGDVAALK
ncbi:MAG: hypothetical protein P8163_14300 [Candidatus Thiodiazotropha sp.]